MLSGELSIIGNRKVNGGGGNSQLRGEWELVENWCHEKYQKLLRATPELLPLPSAKPWLSALEHGFPGSAFPLPRSGRIRRELGLAVKLNGVKKKRKCRD